MKNNFTGRILEQAVENVLLQKNVSIRRSVPYINIYGSKGRTEFVIDTKTKSIRIECKWQQSSGSVDEKFCYLYHNCLIMPEKTIIIVIDGDGARKSAVEWLKNIANNTTSKELYVFNLCEFIKWVNKNLEEKGAVT